MENEPTHDELEDRAEPVPVTALPEGERPEPPAPSTNRGGPIFLIVAAAVVVFALLGTAFLLMQAQNRAKTSGSKTATAAVVARKARVVAATDFLKDLFAGDSLAMKDLLTAAAQNAISPAQWNDIASAIPTASASFDALTWSSDTTATFAFNVEDTTGTIGVGVAVGTTGTVDVLLSSGGNTEAAKLQMLQEGGRWHVLSLTDQTGAVTVYDAAFVKKLYQDATSQ